MTINIFLTYNLDYKYNAQVATARSSNSGTVMPELSHQRESKEHS